MLRDSRIQKICALSLLIIYLSLPATSFPIAAEQGTDVIFIGPQEFIYNDDNFTITLEAQTDIADLAMVDCMLYVNHADIKIVDSTADLMWTRPDLTVEIVKAVNGITQGEIITDITFKAMNTGHDFFGIYWCTYSDMNNNQGLHLNYGVIAPTAIFGTPSYYGNMDYDSDIDGADIKSFMDTFPNGTAYYGLQEGDFNGDGRVGWQDAVMFASCFGADNID